MRSQEGLSKLLLMVYAASTSPELWPQFSTGLCAMANLGAMSVLHEALTPHRVYVGPTHVDLVHVQFTTGINIEAVQAYKETYARQDPWRPRFARTPEGRLAFAEEELCPLKELRKTEFYNDFCKPFEVRLWCSVPMRNTATELAWASFFARSWKGPLPPASSAQYLRLIMPHLCTAMRISRDLRILQAETRELALALDMLDHGVILLDKAGACVFVNREAKRILDQRDGLYVKSGRIEVNWPTEAARLHAAIQQAALTGVGEPGGSPAAFHISRINEQPLHVLVSPFVHWGTLDVPGRNRAAVLLLIAAPERRSVGTELVMQMLYGLTSAETSLLHLLLVGHNLYEAAELNQVTRETVRTQIKSIFNKTGTRGQSELIRLAATLPRINPSKPV